MIMVFNRIFFILKVLIRVVENSTWVLLRLEIPEHFLMTTEIEKKLQGLNGEGENEVGATATATATVGGSIP